MFGAAFLVISKTSPINLVCHDFTNIFVNIYRLTGVNADSTLESQESNLQSRVSPQIDPLTFLTSENWPEAMKINHVTGHISIFLPVPVSQMTVFYIFMAHFHVLV